MQQSNLTELANLFLALSDKTRLRLLILMADGEVPVGFLADRLGESQPKTSRHLAYLRNAGLVSARRDGKWIYYNITHPADPAVARILAATVESIAAVKVDGHVHYFTDAIGIDNGRIYQGEDNIYAETYGLDYKPNEMDVFLL